MGRAPAKARAGRREDGFGAVERHRRQERAVGKLREAFLLRADADEALDTVVVRLHVGVTDRPVHAVAIERRGLELVVRHAIRGTRPVQRAAAETSRSAPAVVRFRRCRVGVLGVVDEDPVVPFAAGVPPKKSGLALTAIVELVEKLVLKVPGWIDVRSGLEHQDLHSGSGELHRCPPAARSRSDDYGVIRRWHLSHSRQYSPSVHDAITS
jgi:hypothetical protein